jgi:hypothetical protein
MSQENISQGMEEVRSPSFKMVVEAALEQENINGLNKLKSEGVEYAFGTVSTEFAIELAQRDFKKKTHGFTQLDLEKVEALMNLKNNDTYLELLKEIKEQIDKIEEAKKNAKQTREKVDKFFEEYCKSYGIEKPYQSPFNPRAPYSMTSSLIKKHMLDCLGENVE